MPQHCWSSPSVSHSATSLISMSPLSSATRAAADRHHPRHTRGLPGKPVSHPMKDCHGCHRPSDPYAGPMGSKGHPHQCGGGIHPIIRVGDLSLHPGPHQPDGQKSPTGPTTRFGPRFPDMLHAYDPAWRDLAKACSSELDIPLHEGVYVGLAGPNLETPAEYAFCHRIGGDLIGMSTVPEVIAARHMGLTGRCLGGDQCLLSSERILETTHEDGWPVWRGRRRGCFGS